MRAEERVAIAIAADSDLAVPEGQQANPLQKALLSERSRRRALEARLAEFARAAIAAMKETP